MPDKKQYEELKEQQSTFLLKIGSTLYHIFLGEKTLEPQINRSVISNTYLQILQGIHIITLFSLFSSTNNTQYSTFQSIFSGLLILICLLPRVTWKHIIFQITGLLVVLAGLGSLALGVIIIENYITFRFYCKVLYDYYSRNPEKLTQNSNLQAMCDTINTLYIIELGAQILYSIFRFIYLFLAYKAYKVAKAKFDEEQTKRRRKQRFKEMLRKRGLFNQKRIV